MNAQAKFGFTFGPLKAATMQDVNTVIKALKGSKNTEPQIWGNIWLPNMEYSYNKNENLFMGDDFENPDKHRLEPLFVQ